MKLIYLGHALYFPGREDLQYKENTNEAVIDMSQTKPK